MKLIDIDREVMSGQCKGTLLRLQVGYTAIFFLQGFFPGWAGSQIGIFAPRKTKDGYGRTGFYFQPWLAPDRPVSRLPKWYVAVMRAFTFRRKDAA